MPASFGPPQPPPPPTPWTGDILKDASNLFAGWADKLTFGITSGIRQVFGYDDVIDYNSAAYHTGAAIGSLHNSLLMVTPGAAGGILGTVQKALNTAGQVGGVMSVIQGFQAGDLLAAVEGVVSIGLASVRGVTACQRASRVAQWGQRALHGVAAARAIDAAYGNFNRGDYLGAFVHLVDAGTNAYMMGCFAAGTPIRTPSGHKNIEDFEVGDEILSRNEYDPEGPIEVQRVEERFVRVAPIVELHVGGQVIRTTAEHPFWVKGKGWTAARLIETGNTVLGLIACWATIDRVIDTGAYDSVYNIRVSNCHTYFIGTLEWIISIWSHNAYYQGKDTRKEGGYDPGKLHDDHTIAKVFGGKSTRSAPAGMNLRKGGLEGELRRYEIYLVANGMKPRKARQVIQSEIQSLARDVIATPFGRIRGFVLNDQ